MKYELVTELGTSHRIVKIHQGDMQSMGDTIYNLVSISAGLDAIVSVGTLVCVRNLVTGKEIFKFRVASITEPGPGEFHQVIHGVNFLRTKPKCERPTGVVKVLSPMGLSWINSPTKPVEPPPNLAVTPRPA